MDVPTPKPAAPELSRKSWLTHPRFPHQVLLLGSHNGFRGVSRRLIETTSSADRTLGVVGMIFDHWLAAMRSHEGYEERKLYPYLESRYAISLQSLRDGHAALHEREVTVRAELPDPGDTHGDPHRLHEALVAFDEILCAHLEDEEDLVIPMLLELEPAEFERLVTLPLDALLDR